MRGVANLGRAIRIVKQLYQAAVAAAAAAAKLELDLIDPANACSDAAMPFATALTALKIVPFTSHSISVKRCKPQPQPVVLNLLADCSSKQPS